METAAKGGQWEADVREKTGGIGFQSIPLRQKRAGERERGDSEHPIKKGKEEQLVVLILGPK